VPRGALQLLPGDGSVGAALVADARTRGVVFTGSTEAARSIQRALAEQHDPRCGQIPLIAETGGQNAMVVDSSALPEQAVADIIASGFDSAGQRCSSLRILLVQQEIADRLLEMLHGAMGELRIGRPDRLDTDIGPVITADAREIILRHIEAMRDRGFPVFSAGMTPECTKGTFVAPTLIEIPEPSVLGREVFGPVVHVVRYRRSELNRMIGQVNALGYGLTFGIHSRVDETIAQATARISAGNIYVNRNMIGAVVGVQPFGGHGLSGTGPKAGGPLYVRRMLAERPRDAGLPPGSVPEAFRAYLRFVEDDGGLAGFGNLTPHGLRLELPGPVGEQNTYRLLPRGDVLCVAATRAGALRQIAAVLATGNRALVSCAEEMAVLDRLPAALRRHIVQGEPDESQPLAAALFEGDADGLQRLSLRLAERAGTVVPVYASPCGDAAFYPLEFLLAEQSISVNTAAAGGNASLMTIG
jgi:RHH-type proline utilization regulon transcriptional repressor/proline dehydrogenase/delta 1-pyrroline-5-carboxylate dehydrogenase